MDDASPFPGPTLPVLDLPALHANHSGCWLRMRGGVTNAVGKGEAIVTAADTPLLILNAPLVASRLGYPDLSGLDLLELYAFVHPARFVVPTPKGLAQALGLAQPTGDADVPLLLQQAAAALLAHCGAPDWAEREGAWTALQGLAKLRWAWAPVLATAIEKPARAERWLFSRLPEWEETAERPQPAQVDLLQADVLSQLDHITGHGSESRPGQQDYAARAAHIFAPRTARGAPHMLLAEAGTGTGKTLGYLAPASLWAHASGGTVWVSTYTKALQRQLRREARRVWGDSNRVVVRKGRENYLCLLNLEDALQGGFGGRAAILAQLVARWAAYTQDGDMIGGDLPGWLGTLFRQRGITSLTDRRGECVYAGCPHYRKCFIERSARASAEADLVIANHALVMVNAARGKDVALRPTRIVFDEGHHVFEAADSTFSADLTGAEAIELRRWVIGPEKGSKGRRRGLSARLADVASYDEAGARAIAAAREAAEALPGDGWLQRVVEGEPSGEIEQLLAAVRATTFARDESGGQEAGYGVETEAASLDGPFIEAALAAGEALAALRKPLIQLGLRLEAIMDEPPDWLDGQGRARIEGARSSLTWRVDLIAAWEALLARLSGPVDPGFVDWLAVDRADGREYDMGLHRRWVDPMQPFAATVLNGAHGVMMTSATLRDRAGDADWDQSWEGAVARSGAQHIEVTPEVAAFESPFDYANQAEVLIVTDIPRGDIPALAGAYGQLIEASGGGALGLFTAIRRLRAVHGRIADRMARNGLPLYAQHVDPIDTGTLVDIFRDDPHASLLGTDALRDGVDVPGDSLRLVIMEQVPWPKPSILHRARRLAHPQGGQAHDDRIIRARLAQAFGRLIRGRGDRGHFVVLSAAFPSRLLTAFPAGTPVVRCTLAEALQRLRAHASGGTSPLSQAESSAQSRNDCQNG
ncbi:MULTISPECIES: ATP-dependent DNA helicase [unclassified Novosphingobium]|uniref:ATP-dependent DNA helicase n=1 Tax=unclassified Novosphingobium TaxID=2644732 RepID=UPI00086E7258|nr:MULTISPECIES: ATP-dependent DNA helicase [unclassified Novosphingobium]MBN9143873.1 ATP-dependent DNA helicase [Novosphingobium sp.]MDR6707058.1 ATP-dependent DNA helicase DinG [Novosphingobium sp. 1748]ODU84456.1 MAG: helicase [Novosphingobium sp. SCN 63-17]OJX92997.1 MAG: helicase [Novosphingobium sp. 63-713]